MMIPPKKPAPREDKMVVVLEGVSIAHEPDLAAEVVRAVTKEAQRQVDLVPPDRRADVVYFAFGKAFVGLRLSDAHPDAKTRETHFKQAKVIYRAVVQQALARERVRAEVAGGTLVTRTGEDSVVK